MISQVWISPTQLSGPVALGSSGVITDTFGITRFMSLAPNMTGWFAQQPAASFQSRVDAGSDTYAVLRFDHASFTAPRFPVLKCYGSASPTPRWTFQFQNPVQSTASGLHVSRDGQTIVAWVFDYTQLRTVIHTFGPNSGTPTRTTNVNTVGLPSMSAMSDDGSTILLVSNIMRITVNVRNGTVIEQTNGANIGLACALTPIGNVQLIGRIRRYVDVFPGTPIDSGNDSAYAAAIRTDGSTVTIAWSNSLVQVIDLATRAIVWSSPIAGTATDMEVSPDGQVIAVGGTWLTVFENRVKTFEQDLPGTVNDVDVTNTHVACGSRVDASTGRVDLFARAASQPGPTEYRCVIPAPAVQGATHPAIAFPTGSGANIQVRVL